MPPTIPAIKPEKSGAPEAKAIPRARPPKKPLNQQECLVLNVLYNTRYVYESYLASFFIIRIIRVEKNYVVLTS